MDAFQVVVLVAGSVMLAVAMGVIAWRELGPRTEAPYVRAWRDVLGIAVTVGGVAVLVAWLWTTR